MPEANVTFNGPCPFCGEFIDENEIDPCQINVATRKGLWQVWHCHAKCFKDRIVKNQYIDLSPAHF
jgi:hypothetical protein